jgi:Fic family protein
MNNLKANCFYGIGESEMHQVIEFLDESNAIERVIHPKALDYSFKAWCYALKAIDEKPLEVEDILVIHKKLIGTMNPRIAGKFRQCDVSIGGQTKFYISDRLLKSEIEKWVEHVNIIINLREVLSEDKKADLAKASHIKFEDIHPFEDGNGRVGRILFNALRLKIGLPLMIIHEGDEQFTYYSWFKK